MPPQSKLGGGWHWVHCSWMCVCGTCVRINARLQDCGSGDCAQGDEFPRLPLRWKSVARAVMGQLTVLGAIVQGALGGFP